MLKAVALIAYPVHEMLPNFYPGWRSWLKNNRDTVMGFLPVGSVESRDCLLGDDVP